MKRDIVVLIDMDDVMEHLVRAWCDWLNKKHGTNVKEEDIKDWKVCNFFPSLTEDEVYEPLRLDDFWTMVYPRQDAPQYIKKLMDEGFKVYICTASDYRTLKSKFEYIIERYFPFISWNQMIIATRKQMIQGDILIDDGVHNLEGGRYRKILMSAPHNQFYDAESHGMRRAKNWEQAYYAVHDYASEITREDGCNESY